MDEKDVQEDGLKSELNISISANSVSILEKLFISISILEKVFTSLDHGQDVLSL